MSRYGGSLGCSLESTLTAYDTKDLDVVKASPTRLDLVRLFTVVGDSLDDDPLLVTGRECAERVVSCVNKISRNRLFLFSIWIGRKKARLFRWDASGIALTELFTWNVQQSPLADFLWRFSLSLKAQGLDPTILPPTTEEEAHIVAVLSPYKFHGKEYPMQKFVVYDPVKERVREFLAWHPICLPASVFHRRTAGYPACEMGSDCVMFLKDSWRWGDDSMEEESSMIRKLNAANVRYVPRYICGGDACDWWLDGRKPTIGGQPQSAQNFDPDANRFEKRVHNRFVTDKIGQPVNTFKSTKHLVQVVQHALIGM